MIAIVQDGASKRLRFRVADRPAGRVLQLELERQRAARLDRRFRQRRRETAERVAADHVRAADGRRVPRLVATPSARRVCAPPVVAEAIADTLVLTGPEPASLTVAVTGPPAEPGRNVGAGVAQVTVGGCPIDLEARADRRFAGSPALSSLAA